MKKTIVSIKLGKLAKKKGYLSAVCDHVYLEDGSFRRQYGLRNYPDELFGNVTPAPKLCELQTWLIDNHKILVEAFPVDSWEEWHYRITIEDCLAPFAIVKDSVHEIHKVKGDDKHFWHSYEKALEEGLYEGLKLIKDEK
jgi:hypothetical protein